MGKYKKFHFCLVVLLISFIFSIDVHAQQNMGIFNDLTISDSGRFYNNTTSGMIDAGYEIHEGSGGTNYQYDFIFAVPTTEYNLSHNGRGSSIVQCGLSFVKNHYYSMTFYFNSDTGFYLHPYYTSFNNKLALNSNYDFTDTTFNYDTVSSGVEMEPSLYGGYIMAYTVIFKATSTSTCILSAYSSNQTTSSHNFLFFGHKYESLGASAPTTAEINSALSGQFDSINSNIDALDSTLKTGLNSVKQEQVETNNKLDMQIEQNKEINKNIVETNDTLKNNDSSEATNEAGSFFSGFETDTFGLTSIITAPLNLIESVTSSTCVPMGLPIPFVEGQTLNLPCLRGIYENHFGTFYDIYKTITFGIVAYWVCVRLFNLVKDFKNPEHDEIEVLEL